MLHKHIIKHAKRAHAHIQNHGHKWLWLLSGVFFFILIYPYFSNAQTPTLSGTILYSPDSGINTTGPVTATITGFSTEEVTITNNDGSNIKTFTGNDSFTFTFENTQGATGEATATVTWIVPEPTPLTSITGTISYSPDSGANTTGSVTATLTGFSSTGVTITNNSGSNMYTFTQTGSFTFTFENTQGATGEATATVTWIIPEPVVVVQPCTLQVTTPTSGAIIGGAFPIGWTNTGSCTGSTPVTVKLRDHNGQRISLGTGTLGQTGINFQSTGLASTGFYTITGVHLSGTTYSGIVYTQDTIYNVYTGDYSGTYTNFATGYKVRLINTNTQDILVTQAGTFSIDNQKPILTGLTGSFAPLFSGSIGKVGIMTASFVASEQLTGGTTFTILGTNITPTSVVQSGNNYSYTIPLSTVAANGALNFTAYVTDRVGNTGLIYGTSSIIFNNQLPTINGFTMTGGNSGSVTLSWTTNVSTKHNISYYKSGTTTTTYFTGTQYGTAHNYTMTNIQNNNKYPFSLIVSDNLGNTKGLSGTLNASTTGALSINMNNSNDIIQLSGQVEANLYLQIMQNEINKFQACKAAITFTNYTIPVGSKSIIIKKPTIGDNTVNQIMGMFLVLFTNKVKEKTTLSQAELNGVADAINNFLVVMKLVDDDDNDCEQKMSTYYLSQFEQLMRSMNFF